jgi:hypothetical protein
LTAGTTYEFKVESKNEYGYSAYSSTLSLLCATIPAVPASVVTTYSHGSTVNVAWSLSTTNGSPITAFKVFIKQNGSTTYTLESVDCDGTSATVIANNYCDINIGTLLASPYNTAVSDSIYAKVSATNVYGESA